MIFIGIGIGAGFDGSGAAVLTPYAGFLLAFDPDNSRYWQKTDQFAGQYDNYMLAFDPDHSRYYQRGTV